MERFDVLFESPNRSIPKVHLLEPQHERLQEEQSLVAIIAMISSDSEVKIGLGKL